MKRLWKKYFYFISNHPKPGDELTCFFCSEFSKADWKALKVQKPCFTQPSQRQYRCWLGQMEKCYSQFFPYPLSPPMQVYFCRLDSRWPTFCSVTKLCAVMSGHQEGLCILFKSLGGCSPGFLSLSQRKALLHAGSISVCCALCAGADPWQRAHSVQRVYLASSS